VLELSDEILGNVQGQPRLARAAGPGERHETLSREQRLDLRQLALAPDETRELQRQVVGGRGRGRRNGRIKLDRLERGSHLAGAVIPPAKVLDKTALDDGLQRGWDPHR
jgi:hypothetical protein